MCAYSEAGHASHQCTREEVIQAGMLVHLCEKCSWVNQPHDVRVEVTCAQANADRQMHTGMLITEDKLLKRGETAAGCCTSEHASAFSCGYVPHTCRVVARDSDGSGASGRQVCSIDTSAVHPGSVPVPPALQHAAALHVHHVPHRHSAVKQDNDRQAAVGTGCKGLHSVTSMICTVGRVTRLRPCCAHTASWASLRDVYVLHLSAAYNTNRVVAKEWAWRLFAKVLDPVHNHAHRW